MIAYLLFIQQIVNSRTILKPIYDSGIQIQALTATFPYYIDVPFHFTFPNTPKVALSIISLTTEVQLPDIRIRFVSATTTKFQYSWYANPININTMSCTIEWFAFLDDNIYLDIINDDTLSASTYIKTFHNPQTGPTSAALLLNRFSFLSITDNVGRYLYFELISVTPTQYIFNLVVNDNNPIPIVSYMVIYGSSDYLQGASQVSSNLSPFVTTFQNVKHKGKGILFGYYHFINSYTESITYNLAEQGSNDFLVTITSTYPTITTPYAFSYFLYQPSCPLYCTSCTNGLCDSCLASTSRMNPNNCETCPQSMYASDLFYDCQQCMSVCETCTTTTTCTVCLIGSQRFAPPLCDQCLPQMFVQANNAICQQCNSYCVNCLYEAAMCIACLGSTGRINPPFCNQCSAPQSYIPLISINCQTCTSYCNGCAITAYQCTACLSTTQRLLPPFCLTCPSQMFIQASTDICQSCALYCNNCHSNDITCISCQPLTQRLSPPNCTTCPSNMFIQSGQLNCQQCNPVCNQCLANSNNCLACKGLYVTNLPYCDQCSRLNHYIDPLTLDCTVCATYCNGCINSSNNCITCHPFLFHSLSPACSDCPLSQFTLPPALCYLNVLTHVCSGTYNRDSTCNCLPGFYNSETSISCLKCASNCSTCTQSATNCVTCNSQLHIYQPPQCNTCLDNYFMQFGTCSQCASQCNTCLQNMDNCIICATLRINPPLCSCPQGYFNDCKKQCSYKCISCTDSANNCLTCSGNRINPPNCDCPDGSISSYSICDQCTLAAPIARFSDDLNVILVIFNTKVMTRIYCNTLLNYTTLAKMGVNPICYVNQNIINIHLGTDSNITLNDPILMTPGVLQFIRYNTSIANIITPLVQKPLNLYAPKLTFNSDIFRTTPCDIVLINILGSTNSGQRNLKLINWAIPDKLSNSNLNELIKLWNSQDLQNSYIITPDYLKNIASAQLNITYSNFIGQVATSTLQILVQDKYLQLMVQIPDQVYIFDTVEISFMASFMQCVYQPLNEAIQIKIKITNSSTQLDFNYSLKDGEQGLITLNPFYLTAFSTYYITATAHCNEYNSEMKQTFWAVLADVKVTIQGGDQQLQINKINTLKAELFNPNNQTTLNDTDQYITIWDCYDIITNQKCINFQYKSFIASLDTTNYEAYSTYYVSIEVYSQTDLVCIDNITVQLFQDQIEQIYLSGNQYLLNQPMNLYDEADVNVNYQNAMQIDVDNLTYQASYSDSLYSLHLRQFYYLSTSIILSNYNGSQDVKFKVKINNPQNSSQSVATLKIRINVPPQQCKLEMFPRGSMFALVINKCVSKSQPLKYKFIYYSSNQGFVQDSKNGLISNGIQLTDYQINPVLMTYLYAQNTSIIVAIIKDQLNAITNTTLSISNIRNTDSMLFYYMLQDNSQKLPRNIMFIMNYASMNNQILNEKYFNKISEIANSLNQSNEITQYIQKQLSNQQQLTTRQILTQFSSSSSQINNISIKLIELQNQQSSNLYNKNYQIQLIAIWQGLYDESQKVSFLYEQSQLVQNRRLLDVSGQNITSIVIQAVANITDIAGQMAKVNQVQKNITTPQFNLTAQKFTTQSINQNIGIQVVNQSNQTVSYKQQNFSVNPYQNDSDFANSIKAPLIVPNLTGANNSQITPANPVTIAFPFIGNIDIICASKVGASWSMDICSVVKSSNEIKCSCHTLSPLSIAQALAYILEQFAGLFEHTIIGRIASFAYGLSLFTYIITVFVVTYFVSMVILFRKDHIDNRRIHPVDNIKSQVPQEDPDKVKMPGDVTFNTYMVVNLNSAQEELYTKTSVIGQVIAQQITKIQGFKIFLQNSHVLFELYYRHDEEEPRVLRLSILFLQIVGQVCIFVLFGKNLAISIVIGLSIFQTAYGVLFQLILSKMIKSKNKQARSLGIIIAGLLTGFCTYLIIAAMALYSSAYYSNIAALSYLASLCADYFVSNILVELAKYFFILKTCDDKRFYKIYEKLISQGLQEIVFGRVLNAPKTKAQIQE